MKRGHRDQGIRRLCFHQNLSKADAPAGTGPGRGRQSWGGRRERGGERGREEGGGERRRRRESISTDDTHIDSSDAIHGYELQIAFQKYFSQNTQTPGHRLMLKQAPGSAAP